MILGTAGHVDHGKTALVRALTGVDTDRLAEEKRRGITIDLGFAPLRLDDGRLLSIVDVPGHEAFVRNMLAGATGVDLAMLVVAADEGVMPQTVEHVTILDLLGVTDGVIAITKRDLVDDEWLALVREDVRAAVSATALCHAEMIVTSATTGEGVETLRTAIGAAAGRVARRDGDDLFRLPVDRVFTVRGTGTVVTGTVWSGRLERDATVRILPGGMRARVRGLESHGTAMDAVLPGMRAAVALAGVDVRQAARGATVVADDAWRPSRLLLARVALLTALPRPLGPRTVVRFHLGTADVGARIVKAGGPIAPGERAGVRLVLDAPVVARAGDRFVLRGGSPLVTIGGGIVDDPQPAHWRSRPVARAADTADARLSALLDSAGLRGVELAPLPVRLGAAPRTVASLLAPGAPLVPSRSIGGRLYAASLLDELGRQTRDLVDEHHVRFPMEEGVAIESIRSALGVESDVADFVLDVLCHGSHLELKGAVAMRRGWSPRLSDADERRLLALRNTLEAAGREPPAVDELEARDGAAVLPLLRMLERAGEAVPVERHRYYAATAVREMLGTLAEGMRDGREYSPAELRDALGLSRKFLIPFLEYCDRSGFTERRPGGRVLAPRPGENGIA